MTGVILERSFDPPRTSAEIYTRARAGGWCLELYRVDWHESFLAADGRAMVCSFAAPDLESARAALRKAGADVQRMWIGSMHAAPAPGSPNVIVERSLPEPGTFEQLHAYELARSWCLEQHRVRWARSYLSADGRRMLCLYEAPDVESVRLAQREAGLPVEAAWGFERLAP